MDVNELLGIDPNDTLAARADELLAADRRLLADLVARRRELGLNQTEVARRMDSDQSTVARIESGGRDLHQSTLRRYAMAVEAIVTHRVVPADRSRAKAAALIADISRQLHPQAWERSSHPNLTGIMLSITHEHSGV